ncbi:MAG TPA: LysM peptidoglycan-binding domain-containing protein [Candidatus Nanoarchaeia archaeon]|nr:hypothetical protein [uncultured archaeon]
MARNKLQTSDLMEQNRSWLSTGIVILIVVALGFLAFDTISRDSGDQGKQEEEQEDGAKDEQKEDRGTQDQQGEGTTLPSTHTVAKGDSLWKLAIAYYNDGYKWTVIASENKLANPDVIHAGNNLTIPKIETAAPAPSAQLPTTYTVVRGDTLWELSQKYYNDPYQWFRIRDANAGKVGKLPNGRPLIEIGSVLTIPKL